MQAASAANTGALARATSARINVTHSGMMFVSRSGKPLATLSADGTFTLTLRLLDRWGAALGQVESYLLTWTGPDAAAWWARHSADLSPGTALHADWHSQRLHILTGRHSVAEIHGTVSSLQLLPKAANCAHYKTAASHCRESAECY